LNRAEALRMATWVLLGLGAALLIAALLLSTYTESRIAKIPLDIDTTLVSDGTGTGLDPTSLSAPAAAREGEPPKAPPGDETCGRVPFAINKNVPMTFQQQVSVEAPANADVVTLQVGSTLRRVDKQKDEGLLLAMVDFVTLNRKTALATDDPAGGVQSPRPMEDAPASTSTPTNPTTKPLPHEGLAYRFPFHTEKKTYPYFDPIAQKPFDANYDGEEDVNGLNTYRFTQNVGYDADGKLDQPVKYPSLYSDGVDTTVTAVAAQWGLTGDGDPCAPITMTRYYAAQRTFWVDPVSGTIIKAKDHGFHYYARDKLKPEVTYVDYTVTSTEDTVETQVASARDERDRVGLWSRVLPISFSALGILALVAGGTLTFFAMRSAAALIDPGLDQPDHGFFGRRPLDSGPMPAAEAATEKLPTQRRPDVPPDRPV
jgi:hypothetical protein